MRCILKERLNQQNLSVRGLAEQGENIAGALKYSTIDNFIRKRTGNLDTAWAICKMMGITLDEAFIEMTDDSINNTLPPQISDVRNVLTEIIDLIISKRQIRTIADIADILLTVGTFISRIGYEDEAAKIIDIARDAVNESTEATDYEQH
jgi:DNA-binding XRE family transcriptional regulator